MGIFRKKLSPQHSGGTGSFLSRKSSLGFTLVAGIVLLLIFALVFSVAYGTRRITTHAAALHTVDETLLSSTIVRAQVALATHSASVDRQFGTNSTDAIAVSVDEAQKALVDLSIGIDLLRDVDVGVSEATVEYGDQFMSSSHQILGLLAENDSQAAQDLASSVLDEEFSALVGELVAARDTLNAEVSRSDLQLGKIGNMARFLVAFIVPTAVILIYRELAKRQQGERELERRLALEQSLGKARDEFVANASHELRTPLTSIYGLALLLEEDPAFAESETAPELLNMIISESSDLSRMVEDLLTTARLDAGALHYTFENVEVTEEVEEVVGPMLRSGLEVAVDCESAIVRADRLRYRQVLRNLLSNARKYGGPKIRVEGHIHEGKFVCAVSDNGEGIPEQMEARLFQRYIHQGHQPLVLGSVGLGLSIVRALGEGMGGSVHYEREDGWTRFVLTLPLVARSEAPVESASGPTIEVPSSYDVGGAVAETPAASAGDPSAA